MSGHSGIAGSLHVGAVDDEVRRRVRLLHHVVRRARVVAVLGDEALGPRLLTTMPVTSADGG